jgi:hypothetical protein
MKPTRSDIRNSKAPFDISGSRSTMRPASRSRSSSDRRRLAALASQGRKHPQPSSLLPVRSSSGQGRVGAADDPSAGRTYFDARRAISARAPIVV